ncbi:MAG: universal stress protein [Candidatus Dormibacteraceae bacterium]
MRALVLIDGLHTVELLSALSRLAPLEQAELLLVCVRGPHSRAGLEMVRGGPGWRGLPPHLERAIADAEQANVADALREAETLALPIAASVKPITAAGEAGRVVCQIAAAEEVDLVVVRAGGRDLRGVGPRSLGPAARFITDHSPCPVLLIR